MHLIPTSPRLSPVYPEAGTLAAGLASLFGAGDEVAVLDRTPNGFASTFASEVVRCRTSDGTERVVLCKYESYDHESAAAARASDYRESIAYEGEVYTRVLQPLRLSVPAFYGLYSSSHTAPAWLVIEYADDGVRLAKAAAWEQSMIAAAGWIGRFHALAEEGGGYPTPPFLRKRDAGYYHDWIRRASPYLDDWSERFSWLPALRQGFERSIALLVSARTIVHGEYYPHNILVRERTGTLCPVDWQTASVGAGEVDLASLTEGCAGEIARACEAEYQRSRWPGGGPVGFAQRLLAARLFWAFRWLADYPWPATSKRIAGRFKRLRAAAEHAGLWS